MITTRPSNTRGSYDFGWLNTRHTFSFGQYQDPEHGRFRSLRVINEDVVRPAQGFGEHPHRDMEILTWVLSGALKHGDSIGNQRELHPGDLQRMSAGTGILHSEMNASDTEPAHFLQIWITPDASGHEPAYDQFHFPAEERTDTLRLLASPDGADGSATIKQDARVYTSLLSEGKSVELALGDGRGAYVQVARGSVDVNGSALSAGDGASIEDEPSITIRASQDAEILLFDLA